VDKYLLEKPQTKRAGQGEFKATREDIENVPVFDNLKRHVDKVLDKSAYNKVDLNDIFSIIAAH